MKSGQSQLENGYIVSTPAVIRSKRQWERVKSGLVKKFKDTININERAKIFSEVQRHVFQPKLHSKITVPHSESGVVPMSSLVGVGQLGFWEVGKGGTIG